MQKDPERYFDRILFARRYSQIENYYTLACELTDSQADYCSKLLLFRILQGSTNRLTWVHFT